MSNYWDLPGFGNLYLEDSWVAGIDAMPGQLKIDIDLVLREAHPAYTQPRQGEQYCYRSAMILFEGVMALTWTDQGRPAAVDAAGERDYGSIDVFNTEGEAYMLTGDFGLIEVRARTLPKVMLR